MVAKGTGFPVAVIPGIQGRWEWMTPAIDALVTGHRVITASLSEMRPSRDPDGTFLEWMRALDRTFDSANERKVSLIGVSFGGLIAACYAARRPERVTSLILVSTPAPVWRPRPGDELCLRFPRLAFPYFGVRGAARLWPELYRARDSWSQRAQFAFEHARRAITAPLSPAYAAHWVREWQTYNITGDCARITAPTLVITGESGLDQVVPVEHSMEYLQLIPGATHVTLPGTGHLGLIAKPYRFAEIAGPFIDAANTTERNIKPVEERTIRHAS